MDADRTIATDESNYSLLHRTSRLGISATMTWEIPELFGVARLPEYGISYLSDNVGLLQFVRSDSVVKGAVTAVKSRASEHDAWIRVFDITREGITVGSTFSDDQIWTLTWE